MSKKKPSLHSFGRMYGQTAYIPTHAAETPSRTSDKRAASGDKRLAPAITRKNITLSSKTKVLQYKHTDHVTTPALLEKSRYDLSAYIAFVILIVVLLLCMIFFAYDSENLTFNSIAMTLILTIIMITFFTSITIGLLINIVIIFTYATYLIVMIISNGMTIGINSYFFMIVSPVLTAAVSISFRRGRQLEIQNIELHKMINKSMIDPQTKMHTIHALDHDLETYRSFAKRFDLEIVLVVWVYRFPIELKQIIGQQELNMVSTKISEEAKKVFRKEDLLFLLSENRWAALTIGNKADTHIIINRIRSLLDNKYFAGENAPRIELKFGAAIDAINNNGEYKTTAELLESAEAAMEYDV